MKKEGQAARYVQMIHAAMGKTMESHLFTGEVSRREFVSLLCSMNPDIVHIHGCWSISSARVARWSRQRGFPVIMSPHGGLNALYRQPDFWKRLVPRIILYQYNQVRRSFVIHASSAAELTELKTLGWKKRIALIPYPSKTFTPENMVEEFRLIYQKTLDTIRQNKLSVRETEVLWDILSLYADDTEQIAEERRTKLTSLSAHEWQTILVYCIDHGIADIVNNTLTRHHIHPPVKVTCAPSRYSAKTLVRLSPPPPQIQEVQPSAMRESKEWKLAADIYMLKYNLVDKRICEGHYEPLTLFLDIYRKTRWTDYDEDILVGHIEKLGIKEFTGRLMQMFSESLNLTVGFMPVDPINDRLTETMRHNLNVFAKPNE
ncbi:MAG: glycosyltransferase [Prevotella sp.]